MLTLGPREFLSGEFVVMAILNRTRDSFYDGDAGYALEDALSKVDLAVREGADIIDVGGVKAGPGDYVSPAEEIDRLVSIIPTIRERYPAIVISADTWRAEVAEAAITVGADLINDAWGGYDPDVARIAGEHGIGLVCTHVGGMTPRSDILAVEYADVMLDVIQTVTRLAERAEAFGVQPQAILIDPGHDFNKTTNHSLEITRRLGEMTRLKWPTLVAVSNKDFIGETLDLPVNERLEGTIAALAVCAELGAKVFRVHNVKEARAALNVVGRMSSK